MNFLVRTVALGSDCKEREISKVFQKTYCDHIEHRTFVYIYHRLYSDNYISKNLQIGDHKLSQSPCQYHHKSKYHDISCIFTSMEIILEDIMCSTSLPMVGRVWRKTRKNVMAADAKGIKYGK